MEKKIKMTKKTKVEEYSIIHDNYLSKISGMQETEKYNEICDILIKNKVTTCHCSNEDNLPYFAKDVVDEDGDIKWVSITCHLCTRKLIEYWYGKKVPKRKALEVWFSFIDKNTYSWILFNEEMNLVGSGTTGKYGDRLIKFINDNSHFNLSWNL